MKLLMKLMLAALVIALLLPFTLLKDDQGKTLMSFSSFSLPNFKMPDFKMPDMPSSEQLDPVIDSKDIVYRWNDSKGNVHFATEPPADGINYTVKGYDHNTNVIQAVKLPKMEVPVEPAAADLSAINEKNSPLDLESVYDKDNIKKIFDDSNNYQQLLNQRLNNQNSAVNQ